jgi:cell division septum initiation protein DivIVA
MTEVERLENEVEQTRERVSDLLEELKERAAPSQIMEDIVDYARDSARNAGNGLVRNLSNRVQSHPLPYTLIGAGLAWLIVSSLKGRSDPYATPSRDMYPTRRGVDSMPRGELHAHDWTERGRDTIEHTAGDVSRRVSETADRVSTTVSETAAAATERASGMIGDASRLASTAASDASHAVSDAVHRASAGLQQARFAVEDGYHNALRASHGARDYAEQHGAELKHFVEERPLVMAGLGIAIGAALGAVLPKTEAEDRMLGETSRKLKDQAQQAASDGIDRLGKVAEEGLRKGKQAVEQKAERQLAATSDEGWHSGEQMGSGSGSSKGSNAAE